MAKLIKSMSFVGIPTLNVDSQSNRLQDLLYDNDIEVVFDDDTTETYSGNEIFDDNISNPLDINLDPFDNGGLQIKTDDTQYPTFSTFFPNSFSQETRYIDCFFYLVRTEGTNGNCVITFRFTYDCDSTGNLETFTFTQEVVLNGFVQINIEPNKLYVGNSKLFKENLFNVLIVDGIGNSYTIDQFREVHFLTFFTYTSDKSTFESTLVKGINTISVSTMFARNGADQSTTISGGCLLYVYDESTKSLRVVPNKTDYAVNQSVNSQDLDAFIDYEVDSDNTYSYQVYAYTISPSKLLTAGTQAITISYEGLTTTYNVNVAYLREDNLYYFNKVADKNIVYSKEKTKVYKKTLFIAYNNQKIKISVDRDKHGVLSGATINSFTFTGGTISISVDSIDTINNAIELLITTSSVLNIGTLTINYSYTLDYKAYKREYYGQVQSGYNFSFVLDGTKDSTQVVVYNHIDTELKPNTICYLEQTDTWWIVKSDKCEREQSEGNAIWKHTISLLGLVELLNNRDLTNCGFNVDRYTYKTMLDKILNLSSLEFNVSYDLYPYMNIDEKVNYLKTFDNYTTYSAIKELFEGLNLTPKMTGIQEKITFGDEEYYVIDSFVLYCVSKSGSKDTAIDFSVFESDSQTIKSDRENYGTRVISNAENVVSADIVRYPIVGGKPLTANGNQLISSDNLFSLPSNVYSARKLFVYYPIRIHLKYYDQEQGSEFDFNSIITSDIEESKLREYLQNAKRLNYTDAQWKEVYNLLKGYFNFEIENGGYYETISGWHEPFVQLRSTKSGRNNYIIFNSKNYSDTAKYDESCIYWEQGKNEIKNFNALFTHFPVSIGMLPNRQWTDPYLNIDFRADFYANLLRVAVEYTPMADLKLKVENEKYENDDNLFNQNGKLVDIKTLSKLVNAHAVEISGNEITCGGYFYEYFDIPKVGQVVNKNNERYIINNVSIDFNENDNFGYMYDCNFTMTKQTALKSAMISANTSIRDYDCPQKNNVIRTQIYKDYIELDYVQDGDNTTPYLALDKIIDFSSSNKGFNDSHACFFSSTFDLNNEEKTFYYNIGCTKYNLNKQVIEVIDFKDNNIIGYESWQKYFVLSISKIKQYYNSAINTPISYVDEIGELKSLSLYFCNNDQIIDIYYSNDILEAYNTFVSVPQEVFEYMVDNNKYDINIIEKDYKKDGLEVPIFEYVCEVGDTNNIVFGANFLKGETGTFTYRYVYLDNVYITQENASLFMTSSGTQTNLTYLSNMKMLKIDANDSVQKKGKNILVYMQRDDGTFDFLFAINNCRLQTTSDIYLYINTWRLK